MVRRERSGGRGGAAHDACVSDGCCAIGSRTATVAIDTAAGGTSFSAVVPGNPSACAQPWIDARPRASSGTVAGWGQAGVEGIAPPVASAVAQVISHAPTNDGAHAMA